MNAMHSWVLHSSLIHEYGETKLHQAITIIVCLLNKGTKRYSVRLFL